MHALLAEINFHSWGLVEWIIAVIIIVAVAAVAYIILTQAMGLQIPGWAVKVFWIVVGCFVGIGAIRLITSM